MHRLFIDFKKACDSVRWKVLHNIFIEFDIPMKLVRLIICMKETCNRFRVGKHLSDVFPIKIGSKRNAFFSSFVLDHALRRVQVNQDGLKLNGRHQLLVSVDDVNILGGSVHTVKKKHRLFSSY